MAHWKRNLTVCWCGAFFTMAGQTLISPFLSIYVAQLGVQTQTEVMKWSGWVYGCTFLMTAVTSPFWGRLADKHGRKLMLIRASLGSAIVIAAMGCIHNVYELLVLRLLMGAVSGYAAAANTLIAVQTPQDRAGWAIGVLSTGTVSGMLIGPLIGGVLLQSLDIRNVFWVTSLVLFGSAIATVLFVTEPTSEQKPLRAASDGKRQAGGLTQNWMHVFFVVTFFLQFGNMAVQPLLYLYVAQLGSGLPLSIMAGAIVASSGIANILAAPRLGKLGDKVGTQKVLLLSLLFGSLVTIPQAFVGRSWELFFFRFLFGISLAGMLPSINTLIKKISPLSATGRSFGFNQAAQYLGNAAGALFGGQIAAALGIPFVFLLAGMLLLFNGMWIFYMGRQFPHGYFPVLET